MSKERAKKYINTSIQILKLKRLTKLQKNEAISFLYDALKELED